MGPNQKQVTKWHGEWLVSKSPHWGDEVSWNTADEIARRLDEAQAPDAESCDLAPKGRYCALPKNHEGRCRTYFC